MYHPTRGGVRGGRDQFNWDDVKVDKHRENYMGHSIKAPVGRWQKGKDLHWYAKGRNGGADSDAMRDEIRRIKEEEEQSMREALGLAPKRSTRPQGSRLDKHEYSELVKRTSTAEDLGAGHAEAAWVHGIGYAKAPRPYEDPDSLASKAQDLLKPQPPAESNAEPLAKSTEVSADEKKRRHEEGRYEDKKRDKREKNEKKRHRDSNYKKHDSDYKKHRRNKER